MTDDAKGFIDTLAKLSKETVFKICLSIREQKSCVGSKCNNCPFLNELILGEFLGELHFMCE